MQLIPGGGALAPTMLAPVKAASKVVKKAVTPNIPPPPTTTPSVPTREEPVTSERIEEAKTKQRTEETKRKGRRASILTSAAGVKEELGTVSRPRASALLG